MQFLFSRRFQHFRSTFDAGNLRIAAELAGVSQPALSKSIKDLENHMSAKLFERTSRGVIPTKAGRVLNRHLLNMEQQARYAEIEVGGLLQGRGGSIRLGAGLVWAQSLVPHALAEFHQQFPNVRIEVSNAISNILVPMLTQGTLDLIVCELTETELPDEFQIGASWTTRRCPWVRSDHPLTQKPEISWQELAEFGWVGHASDRNLKEKIASKYRQIGCTPPQIVMETSSLSSMMQIIGETDLVAVLADQLESDALSRDLVRLPISEDGWNMESAVMFRSEVSDIKPFRWLIDELSQ